MGPKRVISEDQRKSRREYQARYRREKGEDPEWRATESKRTAVSEYKYEIFIIIIIINNNKLVVMMADICSKDGNVQTSSHKFLHFAIIQ